MQASKKRLLDHLVGARKARRGNRNADFSRRAEVDDHLELRRLLDRQIGGLGTLCNSIHVVGKAAGKSSEVWTVGNETTSLDKLATAEHARHTAPKRKIGKALAIAKEKRRHRHYQDAAIFIWRLSQSPFVVIGWLS